MNSGGLAMQNLAMSNSESKKMQQKNSASGGMNTSEKNKTPTVQNTNFTGRY
jgi:hypothetical protein